MNKEAISPIKPLNRTNKYFIYKNKHYPINFSLIKLNSNYFYKQKNLLKNIQGIEIKPEKFEIVEESIPIFISCCQNEPFDITDSTAFSLYHLSVQYEVPELTKLSNEYIQKNYRKLVLQSLLYKTQSGQNAIENIDFSYEEQILSEHFFEFIDDEQIISLPISLLFRIINRTETNFNSLKSEQQNKFIEFLFKCLDARKREASVLFTNLDLGNCEVNILSRLVNKYSDIFDFGKINSKVLMKTTSKFVSEFEKMKIDYSEKIHELESKIEDQQKTLKNYKQIIDDSTNNMNQSFQQLNGVIDEKIKNLDSVIAMNESLKSKIDELDKKSKIDDFLSIKSDSNKYDIIYDIYDNL